MPLRASLSLVSFVLLVVCGESGLAQSRVELVTKVAFTEGPAWDHKNNVLLFSDVVNNRIMRWDGTETSVFRGPSGRANGLLLDTSGRLHACEGAGSGGNRRVTRTGPNGQTTVLTADYKGQRYNSPNDLAMDSKGRLYFTDPRYGDRSNMEIRDSQNRLVEGVYRIDGAGRVQQILTHEVDRPNGIAVSGDDKYLFVADNNNSTLQGNRKLWRFDLRADGSADAASKRLLYDWGTDRGPDGMTLHSDGRLFVAAGRNYQVAENETAGKHKAAIYVFSPDGDLLDTIPLPMDDITNCVFGGSNSQTLFVTCGHKIWKVDVTE